MDIKIILLISFILFLCLHSNPRTKEPFSNDEKQEHFDRLMSQFNVIMQQRW